MIAPFAEDLEDELIDRGLSIVANFDIVRQIQAGVPVKKAFGTCGWSNLEGIHAETATKGLNYWKNGAKSVIPWKRIEARALLYTEAPAIEVAPPRMSNNSWYETFLDSKAQLAESHGFNPVWMPDFLFDFQKALCEWSIRRGRCAKFADCGLGKSPMELTWAENVVRKTNRHVLLLTPIAVGYQMEREATKFEVTAVRSRDGKLPSSPCVVITNYERLDRFNPNDFAGVVCDESSILKNFDGVTKSAVTEFMRTIPYRLLCTATAAPNDFMELGTSSEAIGELGFMDMVGMFFKKNGPAKSRKDELKSGMYRFRGHAERDFWRWVVSWARAIRKPSDLGFDDGKFQLPPIEMIQTLVSASVKADGLLFDMPAFSLEEQRDERKRTIRERCEKAAELTIAAGGSSVAWCYLNPEGDLLTKLIPDSAQVSGTDSDEKKDELFQAFESGQLKRLVTKPIIAGFGMNWQHCAHQTCFPSHSFEQLYQCVRRSWRFGQTKPVRIDVVSSEGESRVLANLKRKQEAADALFAHLINLMGEELRVSRPVHQTSAPTIPSWLKN